MCISHVHVGGRRKTRAVHVGTATATGTRIMHGRYYCRSRYIWSRGAARRRHAAPIQILWFCGLLCVGGVASGTALHWYIHVHAC